MIILQVEKTALRVKIIIVSFTRIVSDDTIYYALKQSILAIIPGCLTSAYYKEEK